MRGPATSVTEGATIRSTPEPSRLQAIRRISGGVTSVEGRTATVSAPYRRTASSTSLSRPTTGTWASAGDLGPLRYAGPDQLEPGEWLAAHLLGEQLHPGG